jgi:hypothetical protein|nr:MAG TPA: hypothetical protein [Bacteriophage sp.]
MSVKTTLDIDSKPYEEKIKEVEKKTEQSAAKMDKAMNKVGSGSNKKNNSTSEMLDKVGDSADKAVTALDSVGGALGNASTGLSGIAGDLVNVFTNWQTAAIAAFGVILAAGVALWDKLTLSAEEYAKKATIAAEKAKKKYDDLFSEQAQDQGYFDRLKELNDREKLSNEEKTEAVKLVQILTNKYGDLGISIDTATGKLIGLDKAQAEFLKRQLKTRIETARVNVQSQQNVASASVESALGVRNVNAYLSPSKFGDPTKSASVSRAEMWNKGGLQGKLDVANEMLSEATTNEDIEKWQNVITALEKLIIAEQEYNNIKEFGEKTEKEYAEALKKRSEEAKKAAETKKKEEKPTKDMAESLDDEITIQRLKLQGLDEEAERQRIINDLKAKGLKIDEDEIDRIMELKKELAGIKLQQDYEKGLNDLQYQFEKKYGNSKQAEINKAKREAEKQKGSALTADEEKRIEKLIELQSKLNNFPQLNLNGYDIQTNSLTARGGFQTGAIETNTDRINTQIANYNKAQVDLLNQIKGEIAKARTV